MTTSMPPAHAKAVVDFWRGAGPAQWFGKNLRFDRSFRKSFLDLHESATDGGCDSWADTPEGALALLILLDQFPRNAFRGTARMYATDALARHLARKAIEKGQERRVETQLRLFFCLPFAHSEALVDQDLSVELNRRLGRPWLDHALDHRKIIQRLGRFPHRNQLLGCDTTPAERAFLEGGGFSG